MVAVIAGCEPFARCFVLCRVLYAIPLLIFLPYGLAEVTGFVVVAAKPRLAVDVLFHSFTEDNDGKA